MTTEFLRDQQKWAKGIGETLEKKYSFGMPAAVGLSSTTAVALGCWGLYDGADDGKDAILPTIAIASGTMGLSSLALKIPMNPATKDFLRYGLTGTILVAIVAIASQNIHKNKDDTDDAATLEWRVNVVALIAVLLSIVGMVAAKM